MTENKYDKNDIVRREGALVAGALKFAVYRVRDTETGEFSSLQFHTTFNNIVLAVMDEQTAKLFCEFYKMNTKKEEHEQD